MSSSFTSPSSLNVVPWSGWTSGPTFLSFGRFLLRILPQLVIKMRSSTSWEKCNPNTKSHHVLLDFFVDVWERPLHENQRVATNYLFLLDTLAETHLDIVEVKCAGAMAMTRGWGHMSHLQIAALEFLEVKSSKRGPTIDLKCESENDPEPQWNWNGPSNTWTNAKHFVWLSKKMVSFFGNVCKKMIRKQYVYYKCLLPVLSFTVFSCMEVIQWLTHTTISIDLNMLNNEIKSFDFCLASLWMQNKHYMFQVRAVKRLVYLRHLIYERQKKSATDKTSPSKQLLKASVMSFSSLCKAKRWDSLLNS